MTSLVTVRELLTHSPTIRDGKVIGCNGCTWEISYLAPQSCWMQYLQHLPQFKVEGHLNLSDSDVRWLKQIDEVF